jgi:hypothetical protein
MKRYLSLAAAVLAAGSAGIGTAATRDAASSGLAACAKVPTRYYRSPAALLWTSACEAGETLGARGMARTYHFDTSDPATVAHRYASHAVQFAHKFVERIGVAKSTQALYEGVMAGFRARGRP